jgi:putative transposase
MRTGRPKPELALSEEESAQLQSIARSRTLPATLVIRAQMVLACAAGQPDRAVAHWFRTTNGTVGKWRRRFSDQRVAGLHDDLHPGKRWSIQDEKVAELIRRTLHTNPPDGASHWSVRTVANATGISKTSVHRYFRLFGLQPHRSANSELSTDPQFVDKLRAVVGLYLNPPDNAIVLCLDRDGDSPGGLGGQQAAQGAAGDGVAKLLAALENLGGKDLDDGKTRLRHQEFMSFLRLIEQTVPASLDLHVIVDNYASHKHPRVKAWLEAHPRWHLHFVPTYGTWLNLVQRFVALVINKTGRKGSLGSVRELVGKIDAFISQYDQASRHFAWTVAVRPVPAKLDQKYSRAGASA